ncbi:hypothetical protein [Saccharibacillus qingshengii]|uniref:hypothetical protein n=1 Tax=Saccharibacillus qingshengii TaxID=1763540 RepID=UPI001557B75D|nr:hypothetical protein [Saccharibacillus qingshengii]
MQKWTTLLIGGFLLLSGTLLYVGIHLAAAMSRSEVTSWSGGSFGRYMAAVELSGGLPGFWLAVLLGGAGLLILGKQFFGLLVDWLKSEDEELSRYRAEVDAKHEEEEFPQEPRKD